MAKIWNLYNQEPHLTQVTHGKVTTSQLDITNESHEPSPLQAGDHKASTNRQARKHNRKRQKQHKRYTKEALPRNQVPNLVLYDDLLLRYEYFCRNTRFSEIAQWVVMETMQFRKTKWIYYWGNIIVFL